MAKRMGRIIKINGDEITVTRNDDTIIRFDRELFTFDPRIDDQVEIHEDGSEYIISKFVDTSAAQGININIDNANNNFQHQNMTNTNNLNGFADTGRKVNKLVYILLAIFLGCIGGHKFYEGKVKSGFLYLVFSWTIVPTLIGWYEALKAAFKPADSNGMIVVG
ncbi:hypothetical protein IGI57_002558 [Enterococcus sp. DIV0213j]|uniref:TM2 domain-containing protein n=1 Tax=Enterococcus sp. DIV0213j TaxID=2774649 RepID=UPI003D28F707